MLSKKCHCPHIIPSEWEGKTLDWEKKTFYFHPISLFFYKPIDLEEKIRLFKKEIAQKGYEIIDPNMVMFTWAPFRGRILTQIKNPEKYDENIYIFDMGKIFISVFKGKLSKLKQAVMDFISMIDLNEKLTAQQTFIRYIHCKQCAKARQNLSLILVKT